MKLSVVLVLVSTFLCAPTEAQRNVEDLVHPMTGTLHEGQTYPAVGVPFAMTHWTPQTRAGETKAVAPYYYSDRQFQGIRGSHFLSGSAVPDYGTVTLMPGVGVVRTGAVERAAPFSHRDETSTPYLYRVRLPEAHVVVAVTGTTRAGIMRFTFTEASDNAWVILENNSRAGEGSVALAPGQDSLVAEVPIRREYAGSGKSAGYSAWFIAQFDHKINGYGTYVGNHAEPGRKRQEGDGRPVGVVVVPKVMSATGHSTAAAAAGLASAPRPGFGMYVSFGRVRKGETIEARVGSSFVSADGALGNLGAEIPDWSFPKVAEQSRSTWHRELSRIQIAGQDPARIVFYTAIYHAFLHPRTLSDVDGSYPRFHDHGAIERVKGQGTQFDDFSVWDIFRAQAPLMSILRPDLESQMVQSLITKAEQGGFLPIFPAWNSYTSEMIGDHASVMIADAWFKGIRGFDVDTAYRLMRKNAMEEPTDRQEYINGKGRRALKSYLQYGYIPLEDTIPEAFHSNEQVSRTLEYAYDDAILSHFAEALGHHEDAMNFSKRGENWRNVIDAETGFARGRHADGAWVSPFDPSSRPSWITEATPAVYTFFVPQNVPGLIKRVGGKEQFIAKLDQLFEGHLYEHGNEPSHHIAYLYAMAGAPEKTQQHVRQIMASEYKDGPDGLAGNDDAGQMSAWYILSALGFYQVAPGVPTYTLGVPRFDESVLELPDGKRLRILARGAEAGRYRVKRVIFNGSDISDSHVSHAQLVNGGSLEFFLDK